MVQRHDREHHQRRVPDDLGHIAGPRVGDWVIYPGAEKGQPGYDDRGTLTRIVMDMRTHREIAYVQLHKDCGSLIGPVELFLPTTKTHDRRTAVSRRKYRAAKRDAMRRLRARRKQMPVT